MKRFLSIFACFLIFVLTLLPSLSHPVVAAENTNLFGIDLIDYSTANNSGSNYFTVNNSYSVIYDVPNEYFTKSIDVIFNVTYGPVPTSVQNKWGNNLYNLTILPIGNGFYRAYGAVRDITYSTIELIFNTGSTSNSYIQIYSFRLNGRWNHFDSRASLELFHNSTSYSTSYPSTSTDGSSSVLFRYGTGSDALYNADFSSFITLTEWKKFDYITVFINAYCGSIDSVSAFLGSVNVPCNVSFLNSSTNVANLFLSSIEVDLRDLDRTISDQVTISFNGTSISNSDVVNQVSIISVDGFLDSEYEGIYVPWFFKIESVLKTGFSNFEEYFGSSGQGTVIKDQTSQQADTINDAVADYGSYDKPSSSDVNSNLQFGDIVPASQISGSTSFLTAVFNVPSIFQVVTLALMLGLIATVIYGKR